MGNTRSATGLRLRVLPLLLALLLAACTSSGSVRRPGPTATPTAIGGGSQADAYLTHLADTGAFRGSVLVARGGTVLLSKGYGPADERAAIPNTPRTRFRIGSITKQFTAMAILVLQERGKLDVRDPMCRYVTPCPQAWAPITLEQLLTHTSGIPDYTNFADFPGVIGTPVSLPDLIARFADRPLDFPPGVRWSYSNSGYILLGAVIERVAGQSYAAFLQDHIFGPLGMTDSGYDVNSPALPAHATGYLSAHVKPVYLDMSEFYAAGALYSTVEDLHTWNLALAAHHLISKQSTDAMLAAHIPCPANGCALPTDLGYGYGWFVAKDAGRTLIYHLGHIDGFLTFNGFYPDDDLDVVVLSNMDSSPVLAISTHLGEMPLGGSPPAG